MLADVLTMTDHCGKPLAELSFCYLGEGRSNTANSLLVTGATLGMDARICARPGCSPSAEIRGIAAGLAAGSGARLLVTEDVNPAWPRWTSSTPTCGCPRANPRTSGIPG